jgi:hypothetical protein
MDCDMESIDVRSTNVYQGGGNMELWYFV